MSTTGIEMIGIIIDPKILDLVNGITYKYPKLSLFQRLKINLGLMECPKPIKVKPQLLGASIPRIKTTWRKNNGN